MPTYYVDATGGNDGNTGLSEIQAWQTIAHVNAQAFAAGDSILFRRGETWTGTALAVTWSGAAGNVITFADYGTGAKPIIDGNDAVNCVNVTGQDYLRFENIEATQGLNSGFAFTTCTYVDVVDCDAHDAGNDNLIFITNCANCNVIRGEFYAGYPRLGGQIICGIEIADGCHDILVQGSVCHSQTGANVGMGISIHSHPATILPYNITIHNVLCYGNAASGIQILKQDNTADADRNIQIIGCLSRNNTDDGIRIDKSVGATNYPDGVVISNSAFPDNTRYSTYVIGDNVTFQRCLFHEGRMFRGINYVNLSILNCVFYLTTFAAFGCFQAFNTVARLDGTEIKNCIFATPDAGTYMIDMAAGTATNADIDYNLHHQNAAGNRWRWNGGGLTNWAGWKAASGQDGNSQVPADPQFIDVLVDNFNLGRSSPALNIGTGVGLPHLGALPDLGRFEMGWPGHPGQLRPVLVGQ